MDTLYDERLRHELRGAVSQLLDVPPDVLKLRQVFSRERPARLGHSHVCEFMGEARVRGQTHPWHLVLKKLAVNHAVPPTGVEFAEREALAYQSGLLTRLAPALHAPRCVSVTRHQCQGSGEEVWLWLEAVPQRRRLPEAVCDALTARRLGQWAGRGLSAPLFEAPWLSRDWLRDWVRLFGPPRLDCWATPVARHLFAASFERRLGRFTEQLERLLAVADRVPPTLCHLDAHRDNTITNVDERGQATTVLLDWAFVGHGPLGSDLGMMHGGNLFGLVIDPALAHASDEVTWRGYLRGLEEEGWQGDPVEVRFAAVLAGSVRFLCVAPTLLDALSGPEASGWLGAWGARHHWDEAVTAERWALAVEHLLVWGDEACMLAERLT